eukprot:gene21953-28033_t
MKTTRADETLDELKNYVVMMDKYSLHNFMIYDGRTLKETPEFHSFKRTYNYRWGSITAIITQLEEFLSKFEIKLAIVNGPKLFELSKLNMSTLSKIDLYSCISNIDQIQTLLDSGSEVNKKQINRAVVKIQSAIRMCLALKKFKLLLRSIQCAIVIQSYARLMIYRRRSKRMIRHDISKSDERFRRNKGDLLDWWSHQKQQMAAGERTAPVSIAVHSTSPPTETVHQQSDNNSTAFKPYAITDRSRLIIFIPSLSVAEYTRLDFQQFQAFQNTHISMLYQLADPDVTMVYITPCQLSNYEVAYHEKFLSLLGVSILPKRLHFITPEMIPNLPPHLSLAQVLWCSTGAMRKLKALIRRHSNHVVLQPACLGWVEKRLANYLNIPLLATDPSVAETVSSRSFMKRVFMDCSMNIPLGAHDIYSSEDLLVALSRLISSNIGVGKWVVRLNYDYNNDSCVILDVEKLETIIILRSEQNEMCGDGNNINAWYSRQIQLSVRKRIAATLKKNLASKIKICRKDLYPSWEYYLRLVKQYGAVVEAEPIEKLGYVDGLCFVDPVSGVVSGYKGVELQVDDHLQTQSYCYPQMITPVQALEGATTAIASHLFTKYGVVGHVTIKYMSFWDALDAMPRLWAVGMQLGTTPVFGALGTTGVATMRLADLTSTVPQSAMSMSLIPDIAEGRFCIYIPIALHDPLKSSHDDVFFKLCKMRGIAFDLQNRVGTLFFLLDAIVGGAVSILCIASSRRKTVELTLHTLSFISQQFGKDTTSGLRKCENLTTILINLKKALKTDKNCN